MSTTFNLVIVPIPLFINWSTRMKSHRLFTDSFMNWSHLTRKTSWKSVTFFIDCDHFLPVSSCFNISFTLFVFYTYIISFFLPLSHDWLQFLKCFRWKISFKGPVRTLPKPVPKWTTSLGVSMKLIWMKSSQFHLFFSISYEKNFSCSVSLVVLHMFYFTKKQDSVTLWCIVSYGN